MPNILPILSTVTLALSLAAHISTFMPTSSLVMNNVWPLHLATLTVFGTMLINLARNQRKKQPVRQPGESYYTWLSNKNETRMHYWTELFTSTPAILRVLCITAFIYAMINFALLMKNLEGGGPSQEDGKYYLTSHGRIIRELSEQEYHRFCLYELRGFSGHWILFSLLPTVYYLTIRKDGNVEHKCHHL